MWIYHSAAREGKNLVAIFLPTDLEEGCPSFLQPYKPHESPGQEKKSNSAGETRDLSGEVLFAEGCSGSRGGSNVCSLEYVSGLCFLLHDAPLLTLTVPEWFPDATPIDADMAAVVDCTILLEESTALDSPAVTVGENVASDEIMDVLMKELPGSTVFSIGLAVHTA